MSKSITQHFIVIRILIILGLLSQQVLIPLELFASTAQPSSSLVRGFTEDVDTYLQRVPRPQPDLFQQAALAAVQDAFNGKLPEISGDRAMEEQIAYYLQQAAENPTQAIGSAPATSSSLAKDGTYRWNSSAEDKSGQAGSNWQMTAKPGGDAQLFAQNFEAMMSKEFLPTGLPADGATTSTTPPAAPTDLSMDAASALPVSQQRLSAPATVNPVPSSQLTLHNPWPSLAAMGNGEPSAQQASAQQATLNLLQRIQQGAIERAPQLTPAQNAPLNALADIQQRAQKADLLRTSRDQSAGERAAARIATGAAVAPGVGGPFAVTVTAPITIEFGQVMTYTFVITNY